MPVLDRSHTNTIDRKTDWTALAAEVGAAIAPAAIGELKRVPDHGGRPLSISMTVHPTLQMSDWRPLGCCRITSGAIQNGVPRSEGWPLAQVTRSATLLDAPKSASLIVPSLATHLHSSAIPTT